jgi:RNA polymerase sigma factor (sigma-70 family)
MRRADDPNPTRSSLLRRLKDWNDQGQWQRFSDTYGPLIYNTAIKAGLTHAEAQDVCQETALSAMKSLRTFEYDRQKGSFKSWLLQLARWRILDQLNKRDTRLIGRVGGADSSTRTATVERQADPAGLALEPIWEQEWKSKLLEEAAKKVKQKVDPNHYQIFDLLFFKNWPVARVAKFLNISAGRVYLTKHRIGNLMKKEIAQLRDTLV